VRGGGVDAHRSHDGAKRAVGSRCAGFLTRSRFPTGGAENRPATPHGNRPRGSFRLVRIAMTNDTPSHAPTPTEVDDASIPSSAPAAAPTFVPPEKHAWRRDLLSGFLVFLIALPLCLGIAMASGFPPVAGIITAVVGGVLATWLGSAPLTIKGPAAGLIVIALGAVGELGAGDAHVGYRRALACIVVAAGFQVVFALLRAGTLGDFFPSAVVHGMLAAIGIIIVSKQSHVVMGVAPHAKEPLMLIAEIPASLMRMNPEIMLIGVISLIILFGHPRLRGYLSFIRRVPAPLLVLAVAIPLASLFDLEHLHMYREPLFRHDYQIGPDFLVNLPKNLIAAVTFPDFSHVFGGVSIKYIVMFALVGSIESLLSAKAVDTLDPLKRRSNLDKDLLATGVGNLIAGLLGGLPMISEIVRSSANIGYGARSRLSNFFHGVFLLLFVAFAPSLIHHIPLSALAAMLIFTGVRLASPLEFVKTWRVGKEQLFVFVSTIAITVASDLLLGVLAGMALEMLIYVAHGAPVRSLFRPDIDVSVDAERATLRVRHAALFTNYLTIKRRLAQLPAGVTHVSVNFEDTHFVDHTVMEKLHELEREWARAARLLEIRGLEGHDVFSEHPLAARKKKRVVPVAEVGG